MCTEIRFEVVNCSLSANLSFSERIFIDGEYNSYAIFGDVTWDITDSFSLTGGLRYTKDEKIYTYFRSNPDGTVPFVDADNLFVPGVPVCEFFLGAPTAGPTGSASSPAASRPRRAAGWTLKRSG